MFWEGPCLVCDTLLGPCLPAWVTLASHIPDRLLFPGLLSSSEKHEGGLGISSSTLEMLYKSGPALEKMRFIKETVIVKAVTEGSVPLEVNWRQELDLFTRSSSLHS